MRPRTALRRAVDERGGDFHAIETVLRAERDAERAVEQTVQLGGELLARARERASEISQRTDARIRKLLVRCASAADTQIDGLRAAHERRLRAVANGPSEESLAAAVARLADWLLADADSTQRKQSQP